MTRRIALWAVAGFFVASGWVAFVGAFAPANRVQIMRSHLLITIIEITAPAALLHHVMLKYYWFILMNALVYALIGLAIELLRRHSLHRVPAH